MNSSQTTRTDASSSTTKGERTRQSLLLAARTRFGRDDFRSVSVTAVAKDVGITPAAVYAHFDDKDDLFAAALTAEIDDWINAAASDSDQRPVATLFANLLAGLDDFPLVAQTLRTGSGDHLRIILRSTSLETMRSMLRTELLDRQAAGAMPADHDADDLAVGVETIVFSLFTTIVRTGLPGDSNRLRGVLSVFDAALGSPHSATNDPE